MKFFWLFLLLSSISFSQIEIGKWKMHVPTHTGRQVALNSEDVFMTTGFSLIHYNKSSSELEEWSKINGLSENGAFSIIYSSSAQVFLVGYENGNLDFIDHQLNITNLGDIKRYPIPADKAIYNFTEHNDLIYLACGFGIVVIDPLKKEVRETYYIGDNATYIKINDITFSEDLIYAATDAGIYTANLNDNLANFNSWNVDSSIEQMPYSSIAFYQNQLLTIQDYEGFAQDSLLYHDGSSWKGWFIADADYFHFHVDGNELAVASSYNHFIMKDLNTIDYSVFSLGERSPEPNMIIKDGNFFWSADRQSGLVRSDGQWNHLVLADNAPLYASAYRIESSRNNLWVAVGSRSDTWSATFERASANRLNNNQWSSFSFENQEGINDTLWDMVDLAIDPNDENKVFFASWGRGLVETTNGMVDEVYREFNSTIRPTEGIDFYNVQVGGIDFDREGRLWIANSGTNEFLKMKHGDEWYAYNMGSNAGIGTLAGDVVAMKNSNQIWMLFRNNRILVFDHNGTPDVTSDDQRQMISTAAGQGGLPSNYVTAIAEDKDGAVWVGTDEGIAVFYRPNDIFNGNSNWDAERILVKEGDFFEHLLESNEITCITVDGGNNKWIGTRSAGVFMMSPNGLNEIHHFTTDNSPIPSNRIVSIGISEKNGEVFIGTDAGLISYGGVATEADDVFGNVYAYPNPVRPGYKGMIAITGLVENASVKISDITGNLVFETTAQGGQAVWDGNRFDGTRVSSGVYLVFCSDDLGEETFATKILIVN